MAAETGWSDAMPAVYDRCLGPALFAPFAQHLARAAAALDPARVLELAAGTGVATAALVEHLPGVQVIATDVNPDMVAFGVRRAPKATWRQADAQQLPLPDHCVELVVCQFGAMFFPDRRRAFGEVARVLTPGGTFLQAIWDTADRSPFPAALTAALGEVLPDDPPTFVTRVPHGYTDPDVIHADLAAAGLVDVTVEPVVLPGHAPSARTLAEGFCLGTPLRSALAERGDLDTLTASIGDALTARLGSGPVHGDLAAHVTTARATWRPATPLRRTAPRPAPRDSR